MSSKPNPLPDDDPNQPVKPPALVPGRINRRDLLTGRIWKLFQRRVHPPLVMRYPKTRRDVSDGAGDNEVDTGNSQPSDNGPGGGTSGANIQVPTIGGISIGPIPLASPGPGASSRRVPVFRPPGAIAEEPFLAGCTRCSDCVDACPHTAIVHASQRIASIAGTPIIDPDVQPCLMCEDFPCITACKPGVLSQGVAKIMIGTARVTQHLCLAHHGTTCTVCSERCPVENAIEVKDGKPEVFEDACTGCGVCRYVCPAPENAILLMPTFVRV